MTSNLKTLNQYILELQELVKETPELGEMPCIYFADDEGNDWSYLYNSPCTARIVDGDVEMTQVQPQFATAICIN